MAGHEEGRQALLAGDLRGPADAILLWPLVLPRDREPSSLPWGTFRLLARLENLDSGHWGRRAFAET